MPKRPPTQAQSDPWSLEVVRGRDLGKVFTLQGHQMVLGNALDGVPGVDLREQEGRSPRRMAPRQAVLESIGPDLTIRDLDSPGGTFVNGQRLLGEQARRLRPGDEIQIGGVLLRVMNGSGPSDGGLPEPYRIGGIIACRVWDDFLIVAAQRWDVLRAELVAGRISDYLRCIHRADLLPVVAAGRSADDQLDEWLGRLPAATPSGPELDIHPTSLVVYASSGIIRQVLRISNVGYRLLRCTVRVEPAGVQWLRIVPPFDGRSFSTIDSTDLPVDVEVPGDGVGPYSATIVIESNGGTRQVDVSIGVSGSVPPTLVPAPGPTGIYPMLAGRIAKVRPSIRIAAGIGLGLAFQFLAITTALIGGGPEGGTRVAGRLPVMSIVCAVLAAVTGLLWCWRRRKSPGDAAMAGIAAGLGGILAATLIHAMVSTIEGLLGDGAWSLCVQILVWAAIGAAAAGAIPLIRPDRQRS